MTNPLVAIFCARFRLLLQYRAAALAGAVTQVAWGFFVIMTLRAYYRSASTPPTIPLDELISYIWLGQAMFALLPWLPDPELRTAVRSGNVGYELLRPLDLYNAWWARALAGRVAPTLLRAIPLLIVAYLFFGLKAPASLNAGLAFALSLVGAILLSTSIIVLVNITFFWTLSGEGVAQMMPVVVPFFAGMILPLPLFPAWLQPLFLALPFRGIIDAPFRLYCGQLPIDKLLGVIVHQWVWIAALVISGRLLMKRALRIVVIQGG